MELAVPSSKYINGYCVSSENVAFVIPNYVSNIYFLYSVVVLLVCDDGGYSCVFIWVCIRNK
jgi:hypothetical protein